MTRPSRSSRSGPAKPKAMINTGAVFTMKDPVWDDLHHDAVIPGHLHCPVANTQLAHKYAGGHGLAILTFLTGDVTASTPISQSFPATPGTPCPWIKVLYPSSSQNPATGMGTTKTCWMVGDAWGGNTDSRTGAYYLALVLAATGDDRLPFSRTALLEVVSVLNGLTGQGYPFKRTISELTAGASGEPLREALMRLADALYFEIVEGVKQEEITHTTVQLTGVSGISLYLAALLNPAPAPVAMRATSGAKGRLGHQQLLERLIRRGGTALLRGPKGTFKTTTVKMAALATDSFLVSIRGAPGTEDRDLMGGLMPHPETGELSWTPGPLVRAFQTANDARVVLLVDECLRFYPVHFNVFIGALDTYSFEEAVALGVPEDQLSAGPDERYYVLVLPDHSVIAAPKRNLSVIFTTNAGEAYLQTASSFDDAFLSRVDLILEITHPDMTVVNALLSKVGKDDRITRVCTELMGWTMDMYSEGASTLGSHVDARKALSFATEIRENLDEGMDFGDAVLYAAEVVVLGTVCPLDDQGTLSVPASQRVMDELGSVIIPLALSA